MNWDSFRKETELRWKDIELYGNVSGYQIQPGSMWLRGLSELEIFALEKAVGFPFPISYKAMLSSVCGIDRDSISIDPDGKEDDHYVRKFYQYPEDWASVQCYLEEIKEFQFAVHAALDEFNVEDILGYLPIYSHRVLVVFKDPMLSPVISVWGDDVIVYGSNLETYLRKEFLPEHEY